MPDNSAFSLFGGNPSSQSISSGGQIAWGGQGGLAIVDSVDAKIAEMSEAIASAVDAIRIISRSELQSEIMGFLQERATGPLTEGELSARREERIGLENLAIDWREWAATTSRLLDSWVKMRAQQWRAEDGPAAVQALSSMGIVLASAMQDASISSAALSNAQITNDNARAAAAVIDIIREEYQDMLSQGGDAAYAAVFAHLAKQHGIARGVGEYAIGAALGDSNFSANADRGQPRQLYVTTSTSSSGKSGMSLPASAF